MKNTLNIKTLARGMRAEDKAKLLFAQLESGKRNVVEVARRNFEIQSRLTPQRI